MFQQTNIQNNLVLVRNEIHNAPPARAEKLAKGAMDVAKSLKDNRDNLRSGNDLKIAAGSLALAGSVLACAGPVGAGAGALCALAGAIMGFFMSDGPNVAEVVRDIVQAAFRQFKDEELQERALSLLDIFRMRSTQVQSWLGRRLNDGEKTVLTGTLIDLNYFHALRPLREQISKHSKAGDEMAERAAHYVVLYATISSAVQIFYAELAAVLGANNMPTLHDTVNVILAELRSYHREALAVVVKPTPETGRFYRALHKSLSEDQRRFLHTFLEQFDLRMQGRLCRIFNTYQNMHLAPAANIPWSARGILFCSQLDGDRLFLAAVNDSDHSGLFRIFGPENNCTIYNIDMHSYMYAADYKPFDKDRRNVFLWACGKLPSQGFWNIRGGTLFNLHHKEYMYAADYCGGSDRKPIFTWRPGNAVKQGTWRIDDCDFSTLRSRRADCCIL